MNNTNNKWDDPNNSKKYTYDYGSLLHEIGHDVYKYEHSTDPADIMFPASTRGDININDFIGAKDRMFKRSFPGIKYISCPTDS